ncbi:MAG: ATP-binding protein [Clostridia bacterium]|nr:ATP-binding protein [Clostridia bacterium]
MDIKKIVITGGPCAGKTAALDHIRRTFTAQGYTVLTVAETATELISGGVTPWGCGSRAAYQTCQLQLQLEKERVFEQAARTMDADRVLIVCDRGAMDNKAYMSEADFAAMLNLLGLKEETLRHRYDAVFHLTTAAKGAVDAYTVKNNSARTETADEAVALDDRLLAAWRDHPHFYMICSTADPTEKLRSLIEQVTAFLNQYPKGV